LQRHSIELIFFQRPPADEGDAAPCLECPADIDESRYRISKKRDAEA